MLLQQIIAAVILVAVCHALFAGLGRLFPCNPEHAVFRSRSIGLDLGYCVLGAIYAGLGPAVVGLASLQAPTGPGAWSAHVPIVAQLALLLVATDFAQYWLHRAFHHAWLWPFHAIHHAAEEVNWTTTFRAHPINYLVVTTSLSIAARLVGFSPVALLLAGPVFFLSGAVTHANLGWTFGPLRYVLASPIFHRWHHSADETMRDRNFAPMFPLWDLLFGTFEMPEGRPAKFGAPGVPGGLAAQLVHPFRRPAAAPAVREPT